MEPASKKRKWYLQGFKMEWLNDPEFKDWLQKDESVDNGGFCKCCKVSFKNPNRSALLKHAATKKHVKSSDAIVVENRELQFGSSSQNFSSKFFLIFPLKIFPQIFTISSELLMAAFFLQNMICLLLWQTTLQMHAKRRFQIVK